ncbi:collagen alpha-6(VI) chain-like isoform X2 [Dendronephthya gigantea]|uniref:collagen alpha-6(VI) chain-like isoform X2 n=1 Tax=Dendronephthya gigantea TaxID=151771 RepID=UPI00106C1A14|nr:collagen alpha-6(VI) chain-like isoform X2 [Dendronephthya gigantea]
MSNAKRNMDIITRLLWCLGLVITFSGVWATRKCSRDNLDIFIVLDGSKSIQEINFARLRNFLSDIVGEFKIGEFESRVGLMQFSNKFRTVIEFDFGKHMTTKDVQDNIHKLVHQYGNQTYAGDALRLVNKHVFPGNTSSSGRPDSEKILLLVTDGQPHDQDLALNEAYELKKKGVHLITVGAGTEKWISKLKLFLNRLGSKPTHNQNGDFRYLSRLTHQLVKDICGSKARQPAPPHKCFQEKNDILILMDGSKSMTKRNFLKARSFLQDFLSRVDIGPSRTHVGVIQYSESHKSSIEVALDQYGTVEDLMAAVAKIMYQGGKEGDLFNALRQADLLVFTSGHGDRVSAPDTIIIFTNGNYNNEGVPEMIRRLRQKKIRILSVGVGNGGKIYNQDKIDALAIGTGDVYDLKGLKGSVFIDDVTPTTCKMTTCTSAAPECSPENQDIIFLVDGSAKIDARYFRLAQRFIKRLINKMTVGKNTTHVGVMQYGSTGRVIHSSRLATENLRSQVSEQISKMVYMRETGRDSNLAYALSVASDTLLNPQIKDREGVTKTIVLITDGDISEFSEVNAVAQTVRNRGIRIIALSNGINSKYETFVASLRLIASGPKEYYRLDNSQFNEVLKELQKTVCISEPLIPDTCFSQRRRVFFALDSSSGRGRKKFKEVKSFVENLVKKLQIGLSDGLVGFMQYDDLTTARGRVVFRRNETVSKTLWRIQNMEYRKGQRSYLGNALRIINNEVFRNGADRHEGYKDLLVIIAHKEIIDAQVAFDEAEKLKDKGVEIISIATGNRKTIERVKSQLQVISTTSTNTHSADYTSLWASLEDVLVNVCGLGQCTSFMAKSCTPKKQDIAFLIDSSRSIGAVNYRRLQRFTRRLASRLDLEEGRTHLGVMQVGGRKESRFQFNMGEFPDRSDVLYMIKDMTYIDSKYTYMGEGLKRIREEVFNNRGRDRPEIPNTLVIFADGHSHDADDMLRESELLKANGVTILAVGYGQNASLERYGKKNLIRMATNHRDVFSIDFQNNDLKLEEKIEVIAKHLVKVDCPRGAHPPVHCTQGSVDLFLLVDGSRSITAENFKFVRKFLRKLTAEFDISENAAHVGLLQFSDQKSMSYEFALNEMNSNRQVRKAIKHMKYQAGSRTETGDALRIVNKFIFNHRNGDRPDVADVLIIFTDGEAHDFEVAKKHAQEMKKRNIRIITIAAGPDAKNPKAALVKQMEALASDPLNVYTVDFSELNDIVDRLIDIDCSIVPAGKKLR